MTVDPTGVESLWARHLDGGLLSEGEQGVLLRALFDDADLRERLLDDLELDGMLRAFGAEDAAVFARQAGDRLKAERDAYSFVQSVQARIRSQPTPRFGRRRRSGRRARGGSLLVPATVAASVLAVPLLLLALREEPGSQTALRDGRLDSELGSGSERLNPGADVDSDPGPRPPGSSASDPGPTRSDSEPRTEPDPDSEPGPTRPGPSPDASPGPRSSLDSSLDLEPSGSARADPTTSSSPTPTPKRGLDLDSDRRPSGSAQPDSTPASSDLRPRPALALAKLEGKFDVKLGKRWRSWASEAPEVLAWRSGDELRARTAARVTLPDGTRVAFERGTTLTLSAVQPVTLSLIRGQVYCHVVREVTSEGSGEAARVRFVVRTPEVAVEVLGTEFGVGRGSGRTTVAVSSGQVQCRNAAGQVRVPAGLGLRVRKGQAPPRPRPIDAGKVFAWARRMNPPERVVFRFDFEDGETPSVWDQGTVVRGPRRAGSRFCLETSTYSLPIGVAVNLAIPQRQQVRAGRRVLRFRYFTRGTSILAQLKNQDYGDNCRFTEVAPAQGRWEWIEIPAESFLAQTRGKPDPSRPIRPGDRLAFLQILFSGSDDTPCYVDDVTLVEILDR